MAKSGVTNNSSPADVSWLDLCEDLTSSSSGDENCSTVVNKAKDKVEKGVKKSEVKIKTCTVSIRKEVIKDKNTPTKVSAEVVKTEEESPWRFSYATILKNSANKNGADVSPRTPAKQIIEKVEVIETIENDKTVKSVKREIQRDFLQDDLSLTSHLDVFHMQSPLKLEAVDEEMASPVKKERETRSVKKRLGLSNPLLSEDAVMPDDILMPSPVKVSRLSTRRKREPGESPLTNKRSKNISSGHNTPKCVVSVEPHHTTELETDEQVLMRRQKQIDYGKNTIGYERYCQMIPKEKRHRKHPQTPPKQVKYSRRAWDGLIKQWRQQLHFWDPPSEGGGNIEDLDISSMSEASSDTASYTSSLPATPRAQHRPRRVTRTTRSSASESSSIADDSGHSPVKDK